MRRRVKLTDLYKATGEYIAKHGDADIMSISRHCNSPEHIEYSFDLGDLENDSFDVIGQIHIKYREF